MEIYDAILSSLPKRPRSFDTSNDPGFWTAFGMILCPSEADASIVSGFISDMTGKNFEFGVFDSEEDLENNEQDDLTGFWYVIPRK